MAKCNEVFEIIVGTYEEYLLGYKFFTSNEEYKLQHTIASHSHKASLRSVAWHNKFLASGGVDECIHLYDMHLRKQCGLLMHHSGTVTCLSFTPDGHYLISASEDGSIAMFAVGSWVLDKVWSKAHKGKAVNCVSVHPSGKMALSVGSDCTLRTWNLVKGRSAYIINLTNKCKRPEIIEWSICGNYFGLGNEWRVDIYDITAGNILRSLELKSNITSIEFMKDNNVCLGDSVGCITCFNFLSGDELWDIPAVEENRIKCLKVYDSWLVVANSKGTIRVYNIVGKQKRCLTSLETSCRITCMTVTQLPRDDKSELIIKKKKKENLFETKVEHEEDNFKRSKSYINDANVHCYPPDQKWHIELF